MSDLVDSTEIGARLDPEEWRDIVIRYQRVAADAVVRFGGYVSQFVGDGLVAFFGYPHAHENDAEQGVRAGLAIVNGIAALSEELAAESRPPLRVRVGIDAGAVVVGEGGGHETDVFGDTPNIASRIQALAEPNSVVITEAVSQLVSGFFVVEDRGAHALKGVVAPIRLHRVLRPSGMTGRLQAVTSVRGLTPFVGREDELRIMQTRWERVQDGDGHVVMITGEAGIGKSRLVRHFRESMAGTPHLWMECSGDPFLQSTPFHAVAATLKRALRWQGTESTDQRERDVERALETAGLRPAAALPLVAPLLNLPVPERYPKSSAPPEDQRRQLLATLVQWTFAVAAVRPLVILIEDLHWIDPSTLELQRLLAEQCATTRLLLIYTARPEFHPPPPLRGHHVHIILNRLSSRQAREMVARVATGQSLPTEVVDAVATRTDGVPLFVEELTRLVVESGNDAVGSSIPATLEDSLMARLDRLGTAKEIVQVGAVVGREFSYALMRAILPIAEAELRDGLTKAADAELLYSRGLPPDVVYVFKHALVQDAAYQALLKSKRRRLHPGDRPGAERRFPELVGDHPEVIAHHYTEAGDAETAAAAWRRAGDMSVARGAFKEAEDHYAHALGLLDQAPTRQESTDEAPAAIGARSSADRDTRLCVARSPSRVRARRRARRTRRRARAGDLHDDAASGSNLLRSELRAARAVADQLLAAATERHGSLRIWGHLANGMTRFHSGDLRGAWTHLEHAVSLYDDGFSGGLTQDPGVPALGYASRTAWHLGMTETARARIESALDLARRLQKPLDLAGAYSYAAGIYLLLGDAHERTSTRRRSRRSRPSTTCPSMRPMRSSCAGGSWPSTGAVPPRPR